MASKCWSASRMPRSEPGARPGLVDQLSDRRATLDETCTNSLTWYSANESTPCCRSGHSARHRKPARTNPGTAGCAPRDDWLVVSGGPIRVEPGTGGASASQCKPSTVRMTGGDEGSVISAPSQHGKTQRARPRRVGPSLTCMFARSTTWCYVTYYTLKRNSTTSPSCMT